LTITITIDEDDAITFGVYSLLNLHKVKCELTANHIIIYDSKTDDIFFNMTGGNYKSINDITNKILDKLDMAQQYYITLDDQYE